MSRPKGQRCDNCRYYLKREPGELVPVDNPHITGFCRRHPPRIIELAQRMGSIPGITADSWCGEWAPAKPQTVTEGAATLARLVLLGDLTAARALADKLKDGDS